MEHLHHFQLSDDPFRSDPIERFDVELPSQQEALARLDRAVRQGRGLCVLVGGVGIGKTRVARRLYEGLEEEQFEAAMMVVLRREVGADWLLARFARQLGADADGADREALIGKIYEQLTIVHEDGRRAVLIVDDAHGLANADTLSEICGLVKLEYEDRRLVTIVLVGAAPLDAALAGDRLLSHHVDLRVELAPLPREEAAAYLAARIEAAGGSSDLLHPGASAALHELAEGAPGRMNTLADNALYEAWVAQRAQVTRSDVELAHHSLGWNPVVQPSPVQHLRPSRPGEAEVTDPELDAVFAPRPRTAAPAEALTSLLDDGDPEATVAPRARRALAEPTRVAVAEADFEPPPKREADDDVDDLFIELLDD